MTFSLVIIFVILLVIELLYFRFAKRFSIIDTPNARSSHSMPTIIGGGIIITFSVLLWYSQHLWSSTPTDAFDYSPFIFGLTLVSILSFADDIREIPGFVRLIAQFAALSGLIYSLNFLGFQNWVIIVLIFIIGLALINIANFMDGINGLSCANAVAIIVPLLIINSSISHIIPNELLYHILIAIAILSFFNFRKKAICFLGDVGSIALGFTFLFLINKLILSTQDVSWAIMIVVYSVDGVLTIFHRIFRGENITKPHRKHAYQIMVNELGLPHLLVSSIYGATQLLISLAMIYLIPNDFQSHLIYFLLITATLSVAYIIFMYKFYHLHEEFLESQSQKNS